MLSAIAIIWVFFSPETRISNWAVGSVLVIVACSVVIALIMVNPTALLKRESLKRTLRRWSKRACRILVQFARWMVRRRDNTTDYVDYESSNTSVNTVPPPQPQPEPGQRRNGSPHIA